MVSKLKTEVQIGYENTGDQSEPYPTLSFKFLFLFVLEC